MTIILCKLKYFFFVKIVKSEKMTPELTSLYFFGQEILRDLWKLICIDNQDSTIPYTREISEMFNITSKYFEIFNNTPLFSRVASIARDLFYVLFLLVL